MKTPFDKIYVLTLPSFKDRYTFVGNQLKDLNIDYQFLWGTDFGNINMDAYGYKIHYPYLCLYSNLYTGKDFSCTINHYNAVYQAYEFGYEKILIMEDDICFLKNKELIEAIFNSIPDDADFVTYDPRFSNFIEDFKQFNNDLIINKDKSYFKDIGQYKLMFGGMLYAIMNRTTMKLYLNNQRKNIWMSDVVQGIFNNVKINKYVCTKCICTDQFNIKNNFNAGNLIWYKNNYKDLNISNFYIPSNYHIFERDTKTYK